MPPKKVIKFGPQNLGNVKGRIKHTRTGACTAKGRCYHGQRPTIRSGK